MVRKNKIIMFIAFFSIVLLLIDQIIKVVIVNNYEKPIGGEIVSITLIQNTGVAFGLNDGNFKNILLTFLIILLILNFIRNQKEIIDRKTGVAISLILSGGISNLIDRVIRGGIVDFIKIKNFAIFNLADCYIVCGWVLLVIFLIKFNREIIGDKKCEKK